MIVFEVFCLFCIQVHPDVFLSFQQLLEVQRLLHLISDQFPLEQVDSDVVNILVRVKQSYVLLLETVFVVGGN